MGKLYSLKSMKWVEAGVSDPKVYINLINITRRINLAMSV